MLCFTPERILLAAAALFGCVRCTADDNVQAINLFDALETGQLGVRFIPANAATATVLLQNLSERAIDIELPKAFAAVPILAQFGQPQNGGQNGGQNGANQSVGGGFGQGNGQGQMRGNEFGNAGAGQGQGNGLGMGFMRIAPHKTRKLAATTVCLEYGKPEPRPRIAYRMIRLGEFSASPVVARLCHDLGRGEIAQNTAQAAAWHLVSGLSWDELVNVNRVESNYLGQIRLFTSSELQDAREFVDTTSRPGYSESDSESRVR